MWEEWALSQAFCLNMFVLHVLHVHHIRHILAARNICLYYRIYVHHLDVNVVFRYTVPRNQVKLQSWSNHGTPDLFFTIPPFIPHAMLNQSAQSVPLGETLYGGRGKGHFLAKEPVLQSNKG